MKAGWQTFALGKMLDIQNGYAFSSRDYTESGYFVMRIGNVQNGYISISDPRYIDLSGMDKLQRFVLEEGDLLVSLTGNVGRVGLVEKEHLPAVLNQRVARLTTRDGSPALKNFLLYFLQSDRFREELTSTGHGAAQQNVSTKDLALIELNIPPKPEQQRIVTILDEAFEGIAAAKANAEKNLQNAHAMFVEQIQAVFAQRGEGWIERCMGDIAQIKGGKRVPKGYKLLSEPTPFPYLRVTDFSDTGSIEMSDLRYVSGEVHLGIRNYIIRSSDLYISIAGTIGKTGIIPDELDGSHLTENACRLVLKPGISNRFVYYFTITPKFIEQAGLNTRTAAQPKLALSRLSTIVMGIPDAKEQDRIVARFDELRCESERLESIYQQKSLALDELKQSLLQRAFKGDL